MELPGDLAVDARQDMVQKLDDGDLGAKPAPYRTEFKADNAGADDQELLRHRGQVQRTGRGDDALFVEIDAVQARRIGAGGDDDVFSFEHLRLAVGVFHFDLAGRGEARRAMEGFDLVFLEQIIDAFDIAVDGVLFVFEHRGEIDRRRADLDAHAGKFVRGFLVKLRRVEHRLRGNAAD